MSSVGDVAAALRAVRAELATGARRLVALAEVGARHGQRLARLLHGSDHPLAARLLAGQSTSVQRLREAAVQLRDAERAVAEYIMVLTGRPEPSPSEPATPSGVPSPGPVRPVQAAVEEIRLHAGRDVAVGRLYDTGGRPLTPLVGPGEAGADEGLTEPRRSMRFVHHVESNATAHMRRHGIGEAVLYLNMRPCAGEDGCHRNLSATLPTGSTLTVYQVYPSGSVRAFRYPGTGEGLTDE